VQSLVGGDLKAQIGVLNRILAQNRAPSGAATP
jgi:hypothetical protein